MGDEATRKLFTEVQRLLSAEQFSEALSTLDKILASNAKDEDALRCKLICLIRDNQTENALALLDANPALSKSSTFERAYCLFKVHQLEESLKVIRAQPQKTFRFKELEAQVLYRLERFDDAIALYDAILQEQSDDFVVERETNHMAAHSLKILQSGRGSDSDFQVPSHEGKDSYEFTYNAACVALARGDAATAIKLLEEAQASCRSTLTAEDPDITEEELEEELGLLRVQLGYAHQCTGKAKEASTIYNAVLKTRPPDATLVAVASNNIVALNKDHGGFDSQKKMRNCFSSDLAQKLASYQREAMEMNQALLMMYMGQHDSCRKKAAELEKKYPDSDIPCLIAASSLNRAKKTKQALETLKQAAATRSSPTISLAIAQSELGFGNTEEALKTVQSVAGLSNRPAIVAWVVALQAAAGQLDDAVKTLDKAIQQCAKSGGSPDTLKALLRGSGAFKLKHNLHAQAVKDYEQLVELDESDAPALAQLISALSHVDLERAAQYADSLPDPSFSEGDPLDLDALEGHNVLRERRVMQQTQIKPTAIPAGPAAPEREKRPRKKRPRKLPPHIDPTVKPDPERWLPKWERKSYSAKKRKRRQHDVSRGTQGSASLAASNSEPATPTSPAPAQPASQPSSSSKKKKGKGRKR